jgi:glycosyltransferase involved in cell wall biosynthesis
MVNCPSEMHLVLFFTRRVSLEAWNKTGIFEREVALYRRLQEHHVKVTFVTYGDRRDLEYAARIPGIRILCNRWGLPPRTYERWLPWLHAPWLRLANIIKTNQTNGAEVALKASRRWRKPLIARCGYMWSDFVANQQGTDSLATAEARGVEARVFSAAERVVVTTPTMVADIARRVPKAAGHTVLIPNYVDTRLFAPTDDEGKDCDLIFVGRLSPQKNVAALLDAIQPLDVRINLVGDGELRHALQDRFAVLDDRVRWLGNVPNAELPVYLNRGRVFVLPSHYEGHPKTLIEAMACGLPVIGADSPGIRELIHHGETGYLCGTDPVSIRAAIQALLADFSLCLCLGSGARRYAVENFALDRILELELALLHEVAAG